MKSKILVVGLVALVVGLGVVYWGGSNFFAGMVIDSETSTLDDSRARMEQAGLPPLPAPEDVSIASGDVTLTGHYYENEADADCAVLLLHGYTGTRYSSLQYAPLFWDRGCDLLAYDARGHGTSSDAYHTYGYFEKRDGQAAYEWLLDRSELAPAQVGLAGVSYGAATALQMVPLLPEAAFVLADSPYESMEAIVTHQANERFGTWVNAFVPGAFLVAELQADFDKDEVSPKEAVAGATTPILLVHSQTDQFTPSTHSEAIFANSNPATTQLVITDWGSPHAFDIFNDYDQYEQIVDQFLGDYLPVFGTNVGG